MKKFIAIFGLLATLFPAMSLANGKITCSVDVTTRNKPNAFRIDIKPEFQLVDSGDLTRVLFNQNSIKAEVRVVGGNVRSIVLWDYRTDRTISVLGSRLNIQKDFAAEKTYEDDDLLKTVDISCN